MSKLEQKWRSTDSTDKNQEVLTEFCCFLLHSLSKIRRANK